MLVNFKEHLSQRISGTSPVLGVKSRIKPNNGSAMYTIKIDQSILTCFLSNRKVEGCFTFDEVKFQRVNSFYVSTRYEQLRKIVDLGKAVLYKPRNANSHCVEFNKIKQNEKDVYGMVVNFHSSNWDALKRLLKVDSMSSRRSSYSFSPKNAIKAKAIISILKEYDIPFQVEDHLTDVIKHIETHITERTGIRSQINIRGKFRTSCAKIIFDNLISMPSGSHEDYLRNAKLIDEMGETMCGNTNSYNGSLYMKWDMIIERNFYNFVDWASMIQKPTSLSIYIKTDAVDSLLAELIDGIPEMELE